MYSLLCFFFVSGDANLAMGEQHYRIASQSLLKQFDNVFHSKDIFHGMHAFF